MQSFDCIDSFLPFGGTFTRFKKGLKAEAKLNVI